MSIPPEGVPAGNDDADPTGMRDVLSSLPEPGPMPEDLADRICASLEHEQGLRAQPHWGATAPVHDLAQERAHRRPQQWILAAAAVVAVGVIGTVVFDDLLGSGSTADGPAAAVSPEGEDSNAQQGSGDGDTSASLDDSSSAGGGSESGVSEPQLQETEKGSGATDSEPRDLSAELALRGVDDNAFALGAQSLLDVASGQPLPDPSDPGLGLSMDLNGVQALDDDELDSCITAAGLPPTERSWVGAPTAVNGEEIVILGSTGSDDPHEAWALDPTCPENADAGVLKGPVSLP